MNDQEAPMTTTELFDSTKPERDFIAAFDRWVKEHCRADPNVPGLIMAPHTINVYMTEEGGGLRELLQEHLMVLVNLLPDDVTIASVAGLSTLGLPNGAISAVEDHAIEAVGKQARRVRYDRKLPKLVV